VPRCRKAKTYRPPTREENRRAFTGFELDELFDEDEIEDLMAAAKRRVVREFNRAVEPNPRFKPGSDRRKTRRTDNYIWGLPNKPSELAHYVQRNMKRSFLSAEQLPQELTELHPKFVEMILVQTQYNVLLAMINWMRRREIWYDEGVGIWQICQSAVDEFLTYRRAARAAIPKFDERSYHGRVRSQSERRGIPEGTSVGRIA
jgi:hypothetical protein